MAWPMMQLPPALCVVTLAPGPLMACPCGLDPVDGWRAEPGKAARHFVHCPDCNIWADGATERAARAEWNSFVNVTRSRLGLRCAR
jgi:hypothetical protein